MNYENRTGSGYAYGGDCLVQAAISKRASSTDFIPMPPNVNVTSMHPVQTSAPLTHSAYTTRMQTAPQVTRCNRRHSVRVLYPSRLSSLSRAPRLLCIPTRNRRQCTTTAARRRRSRRRRQRRLVRGTKHVPRLRLRTMLDRRRSSADRSGAFPASNKAIWFEADYCRSPVLSNSSLR